MSQPAIRAHSFHDAQEAELARWPGVTWVRRFRSKHFALVLTFDGVSRYVTYPTSPGDNVRGAMNHVRDIRAVLKALGAERESEHRSQAPKRQRNRTDHNEPIRIGAQDETRLGRDPFAALASLKTDPPRMTFRRRMFRFYVRPSSGRM